MSSQPLIFISIAAYRDPQLPFTILNCLLKAKHPDRLRFGICWQRDQQERDIPFLRTDKRFRLIEMDWRQSQGACWARAEIMKLWQGEEWFLQVDSHCRFAPGWDTRLLDAMRETGSSKPLLSTYAIPFTPGPYEVLAGDPQQILFQAFTPDGIPQLKPGPFVGKPKPTRPVPARFLAAGFLFAAGTFVEDVPYDPELYFMGEECSMALRAYTHGYDLFHPAEAILWHDYLRLDAPKHWGDHTESAKVARPWTDLDKQSRGKVQRMLSGEHFYRFGLGSVRTIADYEAYAGLSFSLRKAHTYTVRGLPPPNPQPQADWAERIQPWIAKIVIDRDRLLSGALEDPTIWWVGIEDEQGCEISRIDATHEDLSALRQAEGPVTLVCEFPSEAPPASWIVRPLSKSRGWLEPLRGRFSSDDFAILEEDPELLEASATLRPA